MKKVTIRYIHRKDNKGNEWYVMQRRTRLYRWVYVMEHFWGMDGGYKQNFIADTKEELLAQVLKQYYCTTKEFTRITEYSTLLQYQLMPLLNY